MYCFGPLSGRPYCALAPSTAAAAVGAARAFWGLDEARAFWGLDEARAFWGLAVQKAAWGTRMAAQLQLEMYRGEDRVWTFDPVPATAGVDITSWTLVATFYDQDTPPNVVLTKSTTNGDIVITGGVPGFFTLTFKAADTSLLKNGVYPADVWRTDAGAERTLAVGALTLLPTPSH